MKLALTMALRLAWSGNALSLVAKLALAGLVISISVLLFVVSVVNGFDKELRERVLNVLPHVSILAARGMSQADLPDLASADLKPYGIEAITPVISASALAVANDTVLGVQLTGIDGETFSGVSDMAQYLQKGSLAALEAEAFNIIVGARIADQLSLKWGDRLLVVVPGRDASIVGPLPRQRRFKVVGIFNSQSQLDESGIFIRLEDAQRLLRMSGRVHGVQGRLSNLFETLGSRQLLVSQFSGRGASVVSWMSDYGNLYQAIAVQKVTLFLLFSLLIGIAAFNLVSGLMMIVEQRKGDIAIMRSMGTETRYLVSIFCLLGLLLGCIGTLLGVLGGLLLSFMVPLLFQWASNTFGLSLMSQYFIDYLPVSIKLNEVAIIAATAIGLTFAASIYPAWRSTQHLPSRVLANE